MSDWSDFCDSRGRNPGDHDVIDDFLAEESAAERSAEVLAAAIAYPGSEAFKMFLASYANLECARCKGTGYIGQWKDVELGRCFECFPDARMKELGFR